MGTNGFHRGKYVNHSDCDPRRVHAPIVVVAAVVDVVVVVASVAESRSSLGFVNEIHALCFTGVTNNTAVDTIIRAGISPDIVGYRESRDGPTASETHDENVADVVACDVGMSRKRLLTREIIERAAEAAERIHRSVEKSGRRCD